MTYEVILKLTPVAYNLFKEVIKTNLTAINLQQDQITAALQEAVLEQSDIDNLNKYLFQELIPQADLLSEVLSIAEAAKEERKLIIS